jgi:ribosome modulation factor
LKLDRTVITDSNTLAFGIKNNSNALVFGIKNNSNTMLRYQRTDSAALVYLIRTHSAGYAYGIKNNSNTIVQMAYEMNYAENPYLHYYPYYFFRYTLNSARDDSNTLLYLHRTDSAAYAFGIKNNSNALVFGIKNNSNTMLRYQRTDSAALMYLVRTHSAGYAFGIKNNSNTMLRYQRTDSAALVYLVRTHSAGYAYGIKNNSNALKFGIKNNSNTLLRYQRTDSAALVYLIRTHSAGYAFGIKNNSNTLLYYHRTDSNAYAYGIKNNSNEICYLDSLIDVYTSVYTVSTDTTISNLTFFKSGITINATKTLTLNTPITISGALNLGESGTLKLNNDVHFASGVTISTGGYVNGNGTFSTAGSSIILEGNLTIPTGQTVSIKGGTIIDGQGHDLYLYGNLSLDSDLSATLRNVNIHYLSGSQINASGATTWLTLQDVNLFLDGDYDFSNGRLFILDNVVVKGNYKFIFRSTKNMYISPYSTFYFDRGSTFKYIPGAETSGADHYDTSAYRSLIYMFDSTAAMYFNNSTLEAPEQGLLLSRGSVVFENKVILNNKLEGGSENTDKTKALTLGGGSAVYVYVLSGARAEVTGYLDYDNPAAV